jgi:hypothetical protein
MFMKMRQASPAGEADGSYAAFTRRGDDGDNGVMVVISCKLFFFTVLILKRS